MKNLLITSATVVILLLAACSNSQTQNSDSIDTASVKQAAVSYTCPMHPEVISDKPGKCPICKMDLIEKDNAESTDTAAHNNQH